MNDSWDEETWELNMEENRPNIPCEACRCFSKTNQTGFWQWLMRMMAVGGGGGEEGKLPRGAMPSDAPWCFLSSACWWLKLHVHLEIITWSGLKWWEPAVIVSEGALHLMILRHSVLIVTWAWTYPIIGSTGILFSLEHTFRSSIQQRLDTYIHNTYFFCEIHTDLNTDDNTLAMSM